MKPRRPHQTGPPGLAHGQPGNSKTCTFQGPGASNTTKIPRKDPKREKEERKLWREEGKKARNFGPPTLRGSTLLGSTLLWLHPSGLPTLRGSPPLGLPTLRGPTFSLGHPSGPHPSRDPPFVVPKFNIQKLSKLAEVEIGRSRNGRTRKKKAGRSPNWPKSIALATKTPSPKMKRAFSASKLFTVPCSQTGNGTHKSNECFGTAIKKVRVSRTNLNTGRIPQCWALLGVNQLQKTWSSLFGKTSMNNRETIATIMQKRCPIIVDTRSLLLR